MPPVTEHRRNRSKYASPTQSTPVLLAGSRPRTRPPICPGTIPPASCSPTPRHRHLPQDLATATTFLSVSSPPHSCSPPLSTKAIGNQLSSRHGKSPHVSAISSFPFGKPSLDHSFRTQLHSKHVLLPLFKSNTLCTVSLHCLLRSHPLISRLHKMRDHLTTIDFSSLQKAHANLGGQTTIYPRRVMLFLVDLMHFDMMVPSLFRYLGGNHTSNWRGAPSILLTVRNHILDHDTTDLQHIITVGCPAKLNAFTSRDTFFQYWRYGNHLTANTHHYKAIISLAKEDMYQYIATLPSWLPRFIPNLHLSPVGLIVNPSNNYRLVIDHSHLLSPSSTPTNCLTNIDEEPPIQSSSTCVKHYSRIYNLRITYPKVDLHGMNKDASGAFKTEKFQPDVAAAFSYVYGKYLCIPISMKFGSNTSQSNFELIEHARTVLATVLFSDPSLPTKYFSWISRVSFPAPPGPLTVFTQAFPEEFNKVKPPRISPFPRVSLTCAWTNRETPHDISKPSLSRSHRTNLYPIDANLYTWQ